MRKNLSLVIVGLVLVSLAVFLFLIYSLGGVDDILHYLGKPDEYSKGIIYFYGNNCDQCSKVNDYIKSNDVAKKVAFTQLEILDNPNNYKIFTDKVQICGMNIKQVGVPFLFDGTNCVVGYPSVIKFFQDK